MREIKLTDDQLIEELENRGFRVEDVGSTRVSKPFTLKDELCDKFNLPRVATTTEDLLNHIKSKL